MIPLKGVKGAQATKTLEKIIYVNNDVPIPVEILKGFEFNYLDPIILTGTDYPDPHQKRLTAIPNNKFMLYQKMSLVTLPSTSVTTAGSYVIFVTPDYNLGTVTIDVNPVDFDALALQTGFSDTISLSSNTPTEIVSAAIFIQPNWLIVSFSVAGNNIYILVYDTSTGTRGQGYLINYPPNYPVERRLWLAKSEDLSQIALQVSSDIWLFTFDSNTGSLTYITGAGGIADAGVSFEPQATSPYILNVLTSLGYDQYTYDPNTGTITLLSSIDNVHYTYRYINKSSEVIPILSTNSSAQIPNFLSFTYDDAMGTKLVYIPRNFNITDRQYMGDLGTSVVKVIQATPLQYIHELYVARSGYVYIPAGYFNLVASPEAEYVRVFWRDGNYTSLLGGWVEVDAFDYNALRYKKPEWLVVFYGPPISPVEPPVPVPASMETIRWGDIDAPIVVGNFVNL